MIVDKIVKRENNNLKNKKSKIDIPVGKWIKCEACKEILYKESVRENYSICPNCGHYFRMHINKRLESTIDEGTYKRFNLNLDTVNPLNLEDYPKKLKVLREKHKNRRSSSMWYRKNKWRRCCYMCHGQWIYDGQYGSCCR